MGKTAGAVSADHDAEDVGEVKDGIHSLTLVATDALVATSVSEWITALVTPLHRSAGFTPLHRWCGVGLVTCNASLPSGFGHSRVRAAMASSLTPAGID